MEYQRSTRKNPLTGEDTDVFETPYSKGKWKIVQCISTGMVFLENPPEYSELEEDFAWERTYLEEKRRRKESEPILSGVSDFWKRLRKRFRKLARVEHTVLRVLSGKDSPITNGQARVLDVGCGGGEQGIKCVRLLKERHDIDAIPIGVEISLGLAKVADDGMREFGGHCVQAAANVGIEALESDSIDLVILRSYLEHESSPLDVLNSVHKVLKPGGFVVIRVPNFDSWNRKFRKGRWCGFRYPDHVNYFTPKTLKVILENAGLRIFESRITDRLPTNDNVSLVATK
ncbi:MAG: class I SAM-dependent methyltransferase [Opitutaceae bacterium]|nr:class I SAM-dependent methyltransferase [Opitutaceae bacterium]